MKKLILAASLATFATLGLAATSASAKGFHGPHFHGGWGHGHHHHFHGGWGYGGGYGFAYMPRCRWVPGYAGWVRVCR